MNPADRSKLVASIAVLLDALEEDDALDPEVEALLTKPSLYRLVFHALRVHPQLMRGARVAGPWVPQGGDHPLYRAWRRSHVGDPDGGTVASVSTSGRSLYGRVERENWSGWAWGGSRNEIIAHDPRGIESAMYQADARLRSAGWTLMSSGWNPCRSCTGYGHEVISPAVGVEGPRDVRPCAVCNGNGFLLQT